MGNLNDCAAATSNNGTSEDCVQTMAVEPKLLSINNGVEMILIDGGGEGGEK